jgi:hypothetical protein
VVAGEAVKTGAGVDDEVQDAGGKLMVVSMRSKCGWSRLATMGTPSRRGRGMAAQVKGVYSLMRG